MLVDCAWFFSPTKLFFSTLIPDFKLRCLTKHHFRHLCFMSYGNFDKVKPTLLGGLIFPNSCNIWVSTYLSKHYIYLRTSSMCFTTMSVLYKSPSCFWRLTSVSHLQQHSRDACCGVCCFASLVLLGYEDTWITMLALALAEIVSSIVVFFY